MFLHLRDSVTFAHQIISNFSFYASQTLPHSHAFHAFYFTPTFYTYSSMQNIFSSLVMRLISKSWDYLYF